ncbi:MAG: tetratricopeptide repeat protein [Sedimentisphaerales bacterium]|nr:tetratricopeptide repeat protein [Sedimentisphaerales bacterium]
MVRRRLNKKVAFIGSAFFVIITLVFIIVILQLKRDPHEFIKDAEAAIQSARQATDQKIKEQHYDIAKRKYGNAYSRVKTNLERKEILAAMVDFFIETGDWPYVLDCWDKIILIEPDNVKAHYGRLRYFEILGNSGISNVWQQVHEYSSEFLKIAQDKGLLKENISDLKIPALEQEPMESRSLGAYLYLMRGQGSFEQANMGAVTNTEEMLNMAVADFEQAKELEPNNVDVYINLAKTVVTKGELAASKGSVDEREKTRQQALTFLEQGVRNSENAAKAYINLLNFKTVIARESDPEKIEGQFKALESEYMSLTKKFSSNAAAFEALSQFYSLYSQYTKRQTSKQNLDKAVDAILDALKLDESNAVYAIQAADLYHRRYSIYKSEPDLSKAMETAKKALSWPDAQDSPVPGNNLRIRNKFLLNSLLASIYIEQIIEPLKEISESDKSKLLVEAQQAVREIEMIIRTVEDPMVVKWQGMLELAKGNEQEAVIKLNKAYEQLKAVKPAQPPWSLDLDFAQLSYTLAKLFMDTEELGKVYEFLVNAHYSGISEIKPEARLDYVEVILRFNRYSDALQNIDAYEEDYGPNKRCRELCVQTYIYSSKYEEAEKELDKLQADDVGTIRLRLALTESRIRQIQMSSAQDEKQGSEDIKVYTKLAISLLEKLIQIEPESAEQSSIINICKTCINDNEIQQAQQLVKVYLAKFPDNIAISIYKQILSEPEPGKITAERYQEIEKQVLSGISDPIKRAANLGIYYRRNDEITKAVEQLDIAIVSADSIELSKDNSNFDNIKLAAGHLFEIALSKSDWELAQKVLKIVSEKDIDGFHGLFFDARLTAAKNDMKGALAKVDECLKLRPIFSQLYMLRSSINAAIGNEYAYIEDITNAAYLNPLDEMIAKRFAIILYNRNRELGKEATSAQVNETRNAMEKAIALNQGDIELLDLYTEFIAPAEPNRAIAIRQDMLAAVPSVDNAMMLGMLAMNVAVNTNNPNDRNGFFDIAGSAFEQARKIDPNDRQVLLYYTKYLQARGRDAQAKQLLMESKDDLLLSNQLFLEGDFEGAKNVLERLYKKDANDTDVLRGLMLVSQKLNDKEAVKKYSDELLSINNNLDNIVSQIRAFLTVGLITEAEHKLQSLEEKYPDESGIKMLQAWLLFRQDNNKKALETIDSYLQTNKTNPAAWELRSEINAAMAEYDKAISDLKTSITLSDNPDTGIKLAKVYIQISRFDEAESVLRGILRKPDSPDEARLLLENIYMQLNRKTALENLYDDILKNQPDHVQWLNRAAAYAFQIKEYERAEKFYEKSCEILREHFSGENKGNEIDDPLYVTVFDGYLRTLLEKTGNSGTDNWHPEKAETVLKEAQKYINTSYASPAYLHMTEAKLLLHDEDKAAEYSRLALDKIRTNEKYASDVLIKMHTIIGLEETRKFCKEMLEKNPGSLAANYTMYYLSRINNDYDKSIEYINKCIELAGKDSPIKTDYVLKKAETLLYAYSYTSDNKYIDRAISDYESLLSEMPNNIKVLNNLAYMLAESNQRLSDALEYSGRIQDIRPNDPGFLDTYAFVLLKNGKNAEAERIIDEALREYTRQGITTVPAEVYEHKGMIKEKLEKKEEAFTAYKRALELGDKYLSEKTRDRINKAIERVSP